MAVKKDLNPKETIILKEIINGLTNKEIAEKLNLSISTIKTYIQSVFIKLNVNTRVEAAVKGVYMFLNLQK